MKKNMGTTDKWIRLGAAAVIVLLALLKVISGTLGYVLLAVALIFVVTSALGICPLYLPFGISTAGKKK